MKFAFFSGCKIPYYLIQYGISTKAVLHTLGVELIDIEFNCCGYPIRHQSFEASIFSAARNIALAQQKKIDILTPCKCCFGNLKHAEHWLKENDSLKYEINSKLSEEGLKWEGEIKIKHLLSVLFHDIGMDALQVKIRKPFSGLKVAAHYGCHALRPNNVVQFDNPLAPTIFENLVSVTGAECIEWPRRLDCCGNPLWEKNNQLSLKLMIEKLEDALLSGAEALCTACSYCQIQVDQIRKSELKDNDWNQKLPSILYPQLLGLSLGIDEQQLGLDHNKISIKNLLTI